MGLEHIERPRPPWRVGLVGAGVYTECARPVEEGLHVITRQEAVERFERDGLDGLDDVCLICLRTAYAHGRVTWEIDPAALLARDGTYSGNEGIRRETIAELRALHQMVLARPEEFARLVDREKALAALAGADPGVRPEGGSLPYIHSDLLKERRRTKTMTTPNPKDSK